MEYKKVSAEDLGLTNYPAYAMHFQPLDFYSGKWSRSTTVRAVPAGGDVCNAYIQSGTKEYINGWLYGAVQAACGQCQPIVPLQHGKMVSIVLEDCCNDLSLGLKPFFYTGPAFSSETLRAELFCLAKDSPEMDNVYNWEDFFYWNKEQLVAAGFTEMPSCEYTPDFWASRRINGIISLRLDCGSSVESQMALCG